MGVDVLTEIKIKRPRDEVAAFAADPTNATAWYKNIKAVEWETPPPAVVGSRVRFRAQFLGRTLEYTYEVREIEAGTRTTKGASRTLNRKRQPRPVAQAGYAFQAREQLGPIPQGRGDRSGACSCGMIGYCPELRPDRTIRGAPRARFCVVAAGTR